jgi:hypothetical protein
MALNFETLPETSYMSTSQMCFAMNLDFGLNLVPFKPLIFTNCFLFEHYMLHSLTLAICE